MTEAATIPAPVVQAPKTPDVAINQLPEKEKDKNSLLHIQPKLSVGAPDDPYEKEADKVANKVMQDSSTTVQRKCAACGHEDDMVRRSPKTPMIQRTLAVSNTAPPNMPTNDAAATIPFADKVTHFNTVIQALCPSFTVNSTGTVVPVANPAPTPAALDAGPKPTGCCGLSILTGSAVNSWEIRMSQLLGPHTDEPNHLFVLPPANSDISFGHFTAGGTRAGMSDATVAGHEMIGHGAQMELNIHNTGDEDRESFNHHNPTVRIQNEIALEQGAPAADARGLAESGVHRGESFGKVEINGFDFDSNNVSALPQPEQDKIQLIANFILTNELWVDITGHSDPVGSAFAKQSISDQRAVAVQNRLIALGVTRFFTTSFPTYQYNNRRRYTQVRGVSDTQPPLAGAADHANWRRVEIFVASHPAGAAVPPTDLPTLSAATPGAGVGTARSSTNPCHNRIVNTAFPTTPTAPTTPALPVQPKLMVGEADSPLEKEADSVADKVMRMPQSNFVQRKCAECEEEESVQRKPNNGNLFSQINSDAFVQMKCAECEKEEEETVHRKAVDGAAPFIYRKEISNTLALPVTGIPFVQKKCAECEEEEEVNRKPLSAASLFIQAKAASDTPSVTDSLSQSIQSSRGGGFSLDKGTQSFMSERIGADFTGVNIHTGSNASTMNKELNAKAFTVGSDIYFNDGQYQPHSDSGKQLLAHELTHVVQQGHGVFSGMVQRDPLKDEESKYAISYETAGKRNVEGWHAKYKFVNLFVKTPYGDREGIGPGSTPIAYANHVYELQKELKAFFTNYDGLVNGILDDETVNWGYTLAQEYEKDKNAISGTSVDTTVLDRLLHVRNREIKNPEVMYSAFFNYDQYKMIMANKAFVLSRGDKGEHVKFLNMVLNEWGYLFVPGKTVTDIYDDSTWSAVKQFQTDTAVATVDGNVGYGTLHMMDLKLSGRASILVKPGFYSFIYEKLSSKPFIFIDGDGDQKKELKLTFGKSGDNVTVKVMHIDTKEEKGPFSFTFPGLDLNDLLLIKERRSTEGVRTSEIQLLYAGSKKKKEGEAEEKPPEYIIPITPSSSVGVGDYKIGDNAVQFNFEKIESVASMDYAMEEKKINPELTLKLGQYNDEVSLFFKNTEATENEEAKDNKETRTYDAELNVIGVSKLNRVFKPGIALKLKNSKLSLSVISAGLNFVGIDLDSDGEEDIRIYTRVTQRELDKDPAKLRNVFLLFTGPAIAKETEMGFGKRGDAYMYEDEDKSEEVFKQMVASEGETKLGEQSVAGSAQEEVNQLNQILGQVYLKALEDKIISPDTYLAWKKLEISMAYINIFIKGKAELTADDEDKITKTATFADEYFALIKRDAGGKSETSTFSAGAGGSESSTTVTSNPYTTEYEITNDNSGHVTKYEVKLGEEIRAKKWSQANSTLNQLASGFNQWVANQFKEKNPGDKNIPEQTTGLFKYMTAIAGLKDNANVKHLTRLKALYYSYQQFTQKPGLPRVDLPLWYYYDSDSEKWWIVDYINPSSPFKEEVSQDKEEAGSTPPSSLFAKLDSKYHLPKGIVLYANPEGTVQGKIEMTEPWELKDILTWAAVILGGAALIGSIIFSGGASTPVAIPVLFALSAIAGGVAAGINLYDRIRKEDYDPLGIMLDVGTIAASIVGLGVLGSGKIIVSAGQAATKGAPWAGNWAKLALLADQYYTPLVMAGIGIDGFNMAILGVDTINKLKAIEDDGQYANENDKTRAKILLLSQLIFAGGMTILSLKGSLPAINGKQNLVLMPGKDGVPIATTPEAWFKFSEGGDIAARSDEHFGQTLQIREPIFGKEALEELKKIKGTSAAGRVERINKMVLETLNNPTLSAEVKKELASQYIKEMEQLVGTLPGLDKSKFGFGKSLDLVGKLTESNYGMRMVMKEGKIFIEGTEAGTFGDLLQKVKTANTASKAAGSNTELVVINNPIGKDAYEVLVLTRERLTNPPSGFKGENVADLGKANTGKQQFIIDVGSGETSFAKDTIKPEDIQGSTIINAEYAPTFMEPSQTRSDLTWKNAAPSPSDANSVSLLGDPLQNMNQVAGNKNVRQVFINNVNAGYKEGDYKKLAEQLLLSMDDGGRVMVQWDTKPEIPGDPGPKGQPNSRQHINGEELNKALQELAPTYGRTVEPLKDLSTISYDYGIQPSLKKDKPPGSAKDTKITNPVPEKRWDFVFK